MKMPWWNRDKRTCSRKKKFAGILPAMQGFIGMAATGDVFPGLHIYICPHCKGIHLGTHKKGRSTKRAWKKSTEHVQRAVILKLLSRIRSGSNQLAE